MPVLHGSLEMLNRLGFAGARVVGKQHFDGLSSFEATFLLNFINPIGYCLNDFTRGFARHVLSQARVFGGAYDPVSLLIRIAFFSDISDNLDLFLCYALFLTETIFSFQSSQIRFCQLVTLLWLVCNST